MSTIIEKVNAIKLDKDTNLLPNNLRAGVSCLGINGTFIGGHSNAKLFATVSEMNSDSDKVVGDVAIVYNSGVLEGLYVVEDNSGHLEYVALPTQLSDIEPEDVYMNQVVMGAGNNIVVGVNDTRPEPEPEPEPEPTELGILLNDTNTDGGINIKIYGKEDPSNSNITIFTSVIENNSNMQKELIQLDITRLNKNSSSGDDDEYDDFEGITIVGEDGMGGYYTSPVSIMLDSGETTTVTRTYYCMIDTLESVNINYIVRKDIRLHLIIHDYNNDNAIMNSEFSSVAVNYKYTPKPQEGDDPWGEEENVTVSNAILQVVNGVPDYIDLPSDIKYTKDILEELSLTINGETTTSSLYWNIYITTIRDYTPDELITVSISADRRDVYLHLCYDAPNNDLLGMYRVSIKDSVTGQPVLTAVNKLYNYETQEVMAETHHNECVWVQRSHNNHHYTAKIYADGYEIGTTGWWDEMEMFYRYDRETITPISSQ